MSPQAKYFDQPEFQGSLFHSCASRGVETGFKYWYQIVRHHVELAKKKHIIREETKTNQLVKRVWKELRKANNREKVIYINGTRVFLPAGLVVPVPEGIMVEEEVTPGPMLDSKKYVPVHNHTLMKREKDYDGTFDKLIAYNPELPRSLLTDPVDSCTLNRMHGLHMKFKPKLDACKEVETFEKEAEGILAKTEATFEELEYLDRVLFDTMAVCGVTTELASLRRFEGTPPPASTILRIAEQQQASLMI